MDQSSFQGEEQLLIRNPCSIEGHGVSSWRVSWCRRRVLSVQQFSSCGCDALFQSSKHADTKTDAKNPKISD
jgi:hypothetical protein